MRAVEDEVPKKYSRCTQYPQPLFSKFIYVVNSTQACEISNPR